MARCKPTSLSMPLVATAPTIGESTKPTVSIGFGFCHCCIDDERIIWAIFLSGRILAFGLQYTMALKAGTPVRELQRAMGDRVDAMDQPLSHHNPTICHF